MGHPVYIYVAAQYFLNLIQTKYIQTPKHDLNKMYLNSKPDPNKIYQNQNLIQTKLI